MSFSYDAKRAGFTATKQHAVSAAQSERCIVQLRPKLITCDLCHRNPVYRVKVNKKRSQSEWIAERQRVCVGQSCSTP